MMVQEVRLMTAQGDQLMMAQGGLAMMVLAVIITQDQEEVLTMALVEQGIQVQEVRHMMVQEGLHTMDLVGRVIRGLAAHVFQVRVEQAKNVLVFANKI